MQQESLLDIIEEYLMLEDQVNDTPTTHPTEYQLQVQSIILLYFDEVKLLSLQSLNSCAHVIIYEYRKQIKR